MPDEPNKHMDDLLKSYAKKRREDAGVPMELHPATRKMLQSEVARQHATVEPETRAQVPFWSKARPVFAIALFFTLLITVTSIWVRLGTAPKTQYAKSDRQAVASRADEEGESREGKSVAVRGNTTNLMGDMAAVARSAPVQVNTAARPAESVAAGIADRPDATKSKASGEYVATKGATGFAGGDEAGKLGAAKPAGTPSSASPVTAPSSPTANAAQPQVAKRELRFDSDTFKSNRPQQVTSQRYARQTGGQVTRGVTKQTQLDNVLSNFQIEQVDNTIRIVDADGSTYSGQIVQAGEIGGRAGKATEDRDSTYVQKRQAPADKAPAASASKLESADQATGIYFRATGTNRSLNQVVVFEGNVVSERTAVQLQLKEAAPPAKQAQTETEGFFSNARIQGRAVVDGKDEIEIDAVAVEK